MFEKVIPILQAAKKVAIFAHTNPDGDAMGSAYSLKLALKEMGKSAEVFLNPGSDTQAYRLVRGKEEEGIAVADCDLMVALDCGDAFRLGSYQQVFEVFSNTISIDHHITHKTFAKETVVQDISSTCELLFGLYTEMDLVMSEDIAHNLYIGLVSDTGNFKYSCVTPQTHIVAAKLMERGADCTKITKVLFDTKSIAYYSLMKKAIDKLSLYLDGKVAVLYLTAEDFVQSGIMESAAVGIVTLPISVEGVQVGVYIRGREDGTLKVSLRSTENIDVSVIADRLGGGGHMRASGYTPQSNELPKVLDALLQEIQQQM